MTDPVSEDLTRFYQSMIGIVTIHFQQQYPYLRFTPCPDWEVAASVVIEDLHYNFYYAIYDDAFCVDRFSNGEYQQYSLHTADLDAIMAESIEKYLFGSIRRDLPHHNIPADIIDDYNRQQAGKSRI